MGAKLADSFWDMVSQGERWRGKQVIPNSPMAVLARLYGSEGPLRAIGVPRPALPLAALTFGSQARPGLPNLTVGAIRTEEGAFAWVLRWQTREGRPVVGEVLPCEVMRNELPAPEVLSPRVAAQLLDPPAPRIELDAVASRIWDEAIGTLGLGFVLRCLACWWEIESAPRTSDHEAGVMAAAVIDHLRRRCGLSQGGEQASLFGPDPVALERALHHVAAVAGAGPARPW
jgi:hypothetical protein